MHSLNERSIKLMETLIAQLDNDYLKLDNTKGTFMPLIVEKITDEPGFTAVYSLALYGEQNGDLMADPEMTFGENEHKFYPLSFRNDYAGVCQRVMNCPEGGISIVDLPLQRELAEFADQWFQNIVEQQGIKL